MPYPMTRKNGKFCVNGKCYDSEEEARQYQKALYANVPDAKKDFEVTKAGPEYRWRGIVSVNTRDRDLELIKAEALSEVVEREKSAGVYPPLQFHHIDYNIGETDWYGVTGGVLYANGHYYGDPVSQQIAKFQAEHPEGLDGNGWRMSWRFRANPDARGEYDHITRIKEFTTLSFGRASNQDTDYQVEVQKAMLTAEQKKALEAVLGDPVLMGAVETHLDAQKKSAALDEAGVERKSVNDDKPAETAKDVAVNASTQYVHGPEGALNQPGTGEKAAKKCAKCGKMHEPGKCPEEAAEGEGDKNAVDGKNGKVKSVDEQPVLDDSDLADIAKFVKEESQAQAEARIEEITKAINETLQPMVDALKALQERVNDLESAEETVQKQFIEPRQKSLYERLKASKSDDTVITNTDPLTAAMNAPVEPDQDADDIFVSAGLPPAKRI